MVSSPFYFAGIVGSRRRNTLKDRRIVNRLVDWLDEMCKAKGKQLVIVSGHCPQGADIFAEEYAKLNKIDTRIFPVDTRYVTDRNEFREQAFARNRTIAETAKDLFCLVHPDRTGGTENTIGHGLDLARRIFLVDPHGDVYLSADGKYPTCAPVKRLLA